MSESPTAVTDPKQGTTRRTFLKVLGAAGATTAAIGCSSDTGEKLIPYLVQPDETVPGVSNYYASTCRECAAGCGVLLEVRDGRTFKVEGNPDHPINRGALCSRGQAAVQGLYNPDRYRQPMLRKDGKLSPISWAQALTLLGQQLASVQSAGKAGGALFINQHETGSFPGFLDAWLAGFGMPAHLSYAALADGGVIAANKQSYGVAWPSLDFTAAKIVVSFGADFLETWGANVPQQLSFAEARSKGAEAPRVIYVGPRRSLTGMNADTWIACKPGSELAIANAIAGSGSIAQAAQASDVPVATLQALATELAAGTPSLFLAGGAFDLALAVNELNQKFGNVGRSVLTARPIEGFEGIATDAELADAVEKMRAGQVSLLFVRGANPVFTTPKSAKVAAAMAKVPFKVSFSSYPDETAELCDLVLPDSHAIESWGDAQPLPGVISLQQPGMDPVYETRATADVLLAVARANPKTAAAYPTPNYREYLISRYPGGTTAFTSALIKGLGNGTLAGERAKKSAVATTRTAANIEGTSGDMYLVVYPSPMLEDGSGANKPWLQEIPDPVTKVCWQTVIEVGSKAAARLAIDAGDVLRVETPNGSLTAPAYIYPGLRGDTIAIAFGRGHTAYGRYAKNIGLNPGDLLSAVFDAKSGAQAWTSTKVKLTKTGDFVPLVSTEGSARQHGRGIAQAIEARDLGIFPAAGVGETQHAGGVKGAEAGAEEHMPGDASHAFLPGLRAPVAQDAQGDLPSDDNKKGMYDPNHWSGMAKRRWAMTIDLSRCTGCSACVTACYAENNIATVGAPHQSTATPGLEGQTGANILRGREMAWIRLERYFEGGETLDDSFETRFVPMMCQQCGNAPCEPVCPVYATYHSPDGLNVQVYNRCVGTRYCSNNCPYKVRYFNWFGYGEPRRPQYAWPERMNWQLNPDVTVRGKGVMEKCTFCVQRIREAENRAKLEGRAVQADEFTTSCAQACPSNAITFGDAADPEWSVTKMIEDKRAYHVFEELNTFTAVVYLKKVNHSAPSA
ncbi:MAG: 4Fe-4S dicluster domain-containing protein, partial [Gemmatimonadota bacterium]|nr:4Fe-4S dicluster domain-containing protein [Gemmatimonadota bacterium]